MAPFDLEINDKGRLRHQDGIQGQAFKLNQQQI
jgi:hypothetical protein